MTVDRRVLGFRRDDRNGLRRPDLVMPDLTEGILAAHASGLKPRDGLAYHPWDMFEERNAKRLGMGMRRIRRWSGALNPADDSIDDNLIHTNRMLVHAETAIARLPAGVIQPHSLRMTVAVHDAGETIEGDLPTAPFDAATHRAHKAREIKAMLDVLIPQIPDADVRRVVRRLYLSYVGRHESPTIVALVAKYIDLVDAHLYLVTHGARVKETGRIMDDPRHEFSGNLSLRNLSEKREGVLAHVDPQHHRVTNQVLEDLLQL